MLGAESRGLVKRSEDAVAPPTGYLPAAEEDYSDSLAGYSADSFSLPGYSEDRKEVARDSEEEDLSTTTDPALLETTTSLEEEKEETTTVTAGHQEESGSHLGNSDHSGLVTTDPALEDSQDEETDDDTEGAADDTEEAADDTESGAGDESPFSLYSHLSPRIRECPGSSVEVCVAVCPGSSPRAYGACVQGCADRCPDSP